MGNRLKWTSGPAWFSGESGIGKGPAGKYSGCSASGIWAHTGRNGHFILPFHELAALPGTSLWQANISARRILIRCLIMLLQVDDNESFSVFMPSSNDQMESLFEPENHLLKESHLLKDIQYVKIQMVFVSSAGPGITNAIFTIDNKFGIHTVIVSWGLALPVWRNHPCSQN